MCGLWNGMIANGLVFTHKLESAHSLFNFIAVIIA